jgi:hypothetical protein
LNVSAGAQLALAFVKDWFAVVEQIGSWFGFRSAAMEIIARERS